MLSDAEIEAIYALPVFNEVEQALYFEFSDQEIAYAKKYRTLKGSCGRTDKKRDFNFSS